MLRLQWERVLLFLLASAACVVVTINLLQTQPPVQQNASVQQLTVDIESQIIASIPKAPNLNPGSSLVAPIAPPENSITEQLCSTFWGKESLWHARVEARKQLLHLEDYTRSARYLEKKTAWDNWEPEWVCQTDELIGPVGDGHKWVCGVEILATKAQQPQGCLVYSFGSSGDFRFEVDLFARTGCRIHIFDPSPQGFEPTTTAQRAADVREQFEGSYHEIGLGPKRGTMPIVARKGEISNKENSRVMELPVASLVELMEDLGHTGLTIDLLKVDIDSAEYASFPMVWDLCRQGRLKIGQVQIELHWWNCVNGNCPKSLTEFFEGAESCGLRIFHKEPNVVGCAGTECVEYSLVNPNSECEIGSSRHLTFAMDQFIRYPQCVCGPSTTPMRPIGLNSYISYQSSALHGVKRLTERRFDKNKRSREIQKGNTPGGQNQREIKAAAKLAEIKAAVDVDAGADGEFIHPVVALLKSQTNSDNKRTSAKHIDTWTKSDGRKIFVHKQGDYESQHEAFALLAQQLRGDNLDTSEVNIDVKVAPADGG